MVVKRAYTNRAILLNWTKFIDQAKWDDANRRKYSFCVQITQRQIERVAQFALKVNEARSHAFYPLSNNTKVSIECRITDSQDEKCIRETKRKAYSIHNSNSQIWYWRNIDIKSLILYRFHLQAFYKNILYNFSTHTVLMVNI